MKYLILSIVFLAIAACSGSQPATAVLPPVPTPLPVPVPTTSKVLTLTCDRVEKADMRDYLLYACWTPGCTPNMLISTVPQTLPGVTPKFVVDVTGKVGAIGVKSRNLSLMESALGNTIVRFDKR